MSESVIESSVVTEVISESAILRETVEITSGMPGSDGLDGKTLLSGTVDPTTEGANGDFYINKSTWFIFGPKAAGVWPTGVSIIGPAGTNGTNGYSVLSGSGVPSGALGVVNDWYINTLNYDFYLKTGASTWTYKVNLKGPQGQQGPQGSPGADGASFADWQSYKMNSSYDIIHHVDEWWQGPHVVATAYRNNGITNSRIYFHPIIMPKKFTIHDLAAVCANGAPDALCMLALYNDHHGLPFERVIRSDPFDCSYSGIKRFSEHPELDAGKYWLVIQCKDGPTPGSLIMQLARVAGVAAILGHDQNLSLNVTTYLYTDEYGFGDIPNPVEPGSLNPGAGEFPAVYYRFALA